MKQSKLQVMENCLHVWNNGRRKKCDVYKFFIEEPEKFEFEKGPYDDITA